MPSFLQRLLYRLPGLSHIPTLIRRIDGLEGWTQVHKNDTIAEGQRVDARIDAANARIRSLEATARFLNAENIRLNELLRSLIHHNKLIRDGNVDTTKNSFDFQWRDLPSGEAMPSNPEFLRDAAAIVQRFSGLPKDWFPGKRVLDAGCGTGRWSHALCELGSTVTSIDQSPSGVAATKALCAPFAGHRAERRDLLESLADLPTYDLVWCFGVCHHTADMIAALEHVISRVAPNGRLFVMLYGHPQNEDEFETQALYAEWRVKLAPLTFPERAAAIAAAFPEGDLHGYFDALSPPINELVTWEWTQAFLQDRGFTDVRRTITHAHHHVAARRIGA